MKTLMILLVILATISFIPANSRAAGEITREMTVEEAMKVKGPFLIVTTLSSTSGSFFFYYHKVSDMTKCYEIIKNSKFQTPTGGDAEAIIGLYCTPNLPERIWIDD